MRQVDISFAVTVVLHAMNPPLAKITPTHPNPQTKSIPPARTTQPTRSTQGADPRSQSWSHYYLDQKTVPKVKPALLKIAFLGKLSPFGYKITFLGRGRDAVMFLSRPKSLGRLFRQATVARLAPNPSLHSGYGLARGRRNRYVGFPGFRRLLS